MRADTLKLRTDHISFIASSAIIALALFIAVCCSPASAESLKQALADTYKYNPRIDAERARLRATDEGVSEAMSGYRPNISGSADINYSNTNVRPDAAGEGGVTPKGYALNLSQNLFNGFQTTNRVNEAEASVRAGREGLREVERTVLLEAAAAYMDVVRDRAIVRLRENNARVLTRELKATQDRFSVGEVTKTDVAQSQARRAGAISDLQLAKANVKTSRASYLRVVGSPPARLTSAPVPRRLLPKSLTAATGIGLNESPTLISALYLEQGARHTVDRIRGELLPSVDFEASYSNTYDPGRFVDQSETTLLTGRVSVPIYQGGSVSARVRAAKHTHVASLQDIEDARTLVKESITSAWAQWQAAEAQLISDTTQVRANRTALDGVREEERVGQRTLLDVLNAELELLDSQVDLEITRRNQVVAAYTLLSAIGRLDSQNMNLTAELYDTEEHYFEVRRKWWGIDITHGDGRLEHLDLWNSHGQHQSHK